MASVAAKRVHNDEQLANINNDIAQILLKYLQNYWNALMSLSLSCKQWNTRINLFVTQRLAYHSPNTRVQSIAHRNKMYSELSSMMQHVSDIRMYELNEALPERYYPIRVYSVSWDSDLVVLIREDRVLVLNTVTGSVIHPEHGLRFGGLNGSLALRVGEPVAFNECRRTMAIQMFDADHRVIIQRYSVNEKQVILLDTLTTDLTDDRAYRLFLSDDGTVWLRMFHRIVFTSAANVPVLKNVCGIRSKETKDGTLIYHCLSEEPTIKCYDTATRQSWTYLSHPLFVSSGAGEYPLITFHAGYEFVSTGSDISAFFVVVEGKINFFMAADSHNWIDVSPDRTRFLFSDTIEHSMTIYTIDNRAEDYIAKQFEENIGAHINEPLCHEQARFSVLDKNGPNKEKLNNPTYYQYHWLNNNKVFLRAAETFAVIDIRQPPKELHGVGLPFGFGIRRFYVVDERTVIFLPDEEVNNSAVIFKVTL